MKVSLIIPVYKAESYISALGTDLHRQTCRDMEVLFVEDGSPDRSGEILDRLAERDARFRVIHQVNRGTAEARNAGIAAAAGEYLMFMDDDDRIPPGYVQEFLESIGRMRADLVIGGWQRVAEDGRILQTRRLVRREMRAFKAQAGTSDEAGTAVNQIDGTADMPGSVTADKRSSGTADKQNGGIAEMRIGGERGLEWPKFIHIAPWAKIYRASFVRRAGARFLPYTYGEDIYFQMMLYAAHPKIGYIPTVSYRWMSRETSITNTLHRGIRKEADIFPMLEKLLEVYPGRDAYFRYFLYRHCVYHIFTSGRGAGYRRLRDEILRCRGWLQKNDCFCPVSPFSPKLKGELARDRMACAAMRVIMRLHMEGIFARAYGGRDEAPENG